MIHNVKDSDSLFTVDLATRQLNTTSGKIRLMQGDHNSECFAFDIPRYIDGHDMAKCNVVRVHFVNIDAQTKEASKDCYTVTDLAPKEGAENDLVSCSWIISKAATKYRGTLGFALRFMCLDTENSVLHYSWGTAIYTGISVGESYEFDGDHINAEYSDLFEEIKKQLAEGGLPRINLNENYDADPTNPGSSYSEIGYHTGVYVEHFGSDGKWRPMLRRANNAALSSLGTVEAFQKNIKSSRIPITNSDGRLEIVAPDQTVAVVYNDDDTPNPTSTNAQNCAIPLHYADKRYTKVRASDKKYEIAYTRLTGGTETFKLISAGLTDKVPVDEEHPERTESKPSIPIRDKTSQNFHVGGTTKNNHPINANSLIDRLSMEIDSDYKLSLIYNAPEKVDGKTKVVLTTIDLPLESMVIDGRYDAVGKKIILFLNQNDAADDPIELDVPIGDLVAGLVSQQDFNTWAQDVEWLEAIVHNHDRDITTAQQTADGADNNVKALLDGTKAVVRAVCDGDDNVISQTYVKVGSDGDATQFGTRITAIENGTKIVPQATNARTYPNPENASAGFPLLYVRGPATATMSAWYKNPGSDQQLKGTITFNFYNIGGVFGVMTCRGKCDENFFVALRDKYSSRNGASGVSIYEAMESIGISSLSEVKVYDRHHWTTLSDNQLEDISTEIVFNAHSLYFDYFNEDTTGANPIYYNFNTIFTIQEEEA